MDRVIFEQDGHKIEIESTDPDLALRPMSADGVTKVAEKSFRSAIETIGVLADSFANVLHGRKVGNAEIQLGLKVTAKGDFVIVGSSAEASLQLKLTIEPK